MKKRGGQGESHLLRTIHWGELQCIKRQICIRYEDRQGFSFHPAAYWLFSNTLFLFRQILQQYSESWMLEGLGLKLTVERPLGGWIEAWFNKPWVQAGLHRGLAPLVEKLQCRWGWKPNLSHRRGSTLTGAGSLLLLFCHFKFVVNTQGNDSDDGTDVNRRLTACFKSVLIVKLSN